MKIILVGGQSIPGAGGVEAYMYNLAITLKSYGNETTLICSDRNAYTEIVDEIEIIHNNCPRSNVIAIPLLFFKSIPYIIKHRKEIDIVNFQSILFAFIPGWIALLCGCKVCYTIHSLAEDNHKHGYLFRILIKIVAFISIWLCGKNILTISHTKAQEIKKRYGKTCSVIPCGVNRPVDICNSDILKRFNIKAGYYYLTIGRIDPIKNLDILIDAFNKRDNSKFQLVIAGDFANDYGLSLIECAKSNPNIIFVGRVMGNDKEFLLKNCFVNCLVSSSEGMPISLLEAMAYGKPCIVSDIPAIHEVVQYDWVKWCNARDINSLADQMSVSESNYNATISSGKEMANYIMKNHTWDKIAQRYIDYIIQL